MGRVFGGGRPSFDVNAQIAAQRQLQLEAEERAEKRRQEEERKALERAAAEYRSRLASMQGRRANRLVSNMRETLNKLGLLG